MTWESASDSETVIRDEVMNLALPVRCHRYLAMVGGEEAAAGARGAVLVNQTLSCIYGRQIEMTQKWDDGPTTRLTNTRGVVAPPLRNLE